MTYVALTAWQAHMQSRLGVGLNVVAALALSFMWPGHVSGCICTAGRTGAYLDLLEQATAGPAHIISVSRTVHTECGVERSNKAGRPTQSLDRASLG